jgi:hypothetical protein
MFSCIFGTVVEVKQISTKDRLERKKYMGVCRWESVKVTRIMSRFPNIVTRYMDMNTLKRRSCISGSSERPKRMNCDWLVWFLCFYVYNRSIGEERKVNIQNQSNGTSVT